jgi:molecular chaperone Hsp33
VVADYDTSGGLRGYCRFDPERVAEASTGFARPGAKTLLGDGLFIMTVDQGEVGERYQGVTAIEGESLSLCAEAYFAQSEQVPTRVRLAVGQLTVGDRTSWRAGGAMIQNIAEDEARGSTEDAWARAQALFATTGDDELIDPEIASGACSTACSTRTACGCSSPAAARFCRCSDDRILGLLRSSPRGAHRHGRAVRQDPRDLRVLLARLRGGAGGGLTLQAASSARSRSRARSAAPPSRR